MKVSKREKKAETKKLEVTNHLGTLHQRLYHGLNLGFRYSDNKEKEWYSNDVEIQRLVVRKMSAFLDAIVPETWQLCIVKDCIPDMVRAIGGILQSSNEAVLAMGSEVATKLISTLPFSMLQPHFDHLSHSLAPLLSYHQSQVAITSATALNLMLSNLSIKKEKEVVEILEKHDVVTHVINNLRVFCDKVTPLEYFLEMASLLYSIMLLWPPSRYPVWSDVKLMEVMEIIFRKPEATAKVAVLRLYSALALCANGAQKLLDNGNILIKNVLQCLTTSEPYSVRVSAFKVAQHLMATKRLCSEVLKLSCEHVVNSIICALTDSSVIHGEISKQDMSLILEACHLALITRWPGKHHEYMWRFSVDKVLANLFLYNFHNLLPHQESFSVVELIAIAREGLSSNFLLDLRPFVWEIIGWLSAHCDKSFSPSKRENEHCISLLVASACLAFVDSIGRERLLCQADRTYTFRSISATKATLLMVYSPCKYISSQARLMLSEALRSDGEEYLKHLLHGLKFVFSGDVSRMPDRFQLLISLISLTCYSGLPELYRLVVKYGGIKTLLAFVRWWLDNALFVDKVSLTSHLRVTSVERTCCMIDSEEWEGEEIHLLLALWSLAELINCHESEGQPLDIFAGETTYTKEHFIQDILKISIDTTSPGVGWYCSYVLSFFGYYGFPSKLGNRIKSFYVEDHGDMCLFLRNGQCLSVHQVILLIRCPSLLPPGDTSSEEKLSRSNALSAIQGTDKCWTKKEVTLSAQVDQQALSRLLDFIYSGYLQDEGALLRKLRMLVKYCNIQPLLQLLSRKRPKWEALMPTFDLTAALGAVGHMFSDIILEAMSAENAGWTCIYCSLASPHIHAHRVILSASCDYMRALFQSGMQESHSQSLKVPVSWEALHKIGIWLYSNDIPKPVSGCLWANMDVQQKISELQPYVELCWLAEFWILDDVRKGCSTIITSSLDSPELVIKVIEVAANFSQWELVDIAANRIAPVYRSLHCSGALDVLDEALVEMIRQASVRLSQE